MAVKRSRGDSPSTGASPKADAKRRKTTVSSPATSPSGSPPDDDAAVPPVVRRATTYAELCSMFEAVEATTKRLIIAAEVRRFLVRVLRTGLEDDFLSCVYLCINRLGPDYEGLELGIGEGLIIKAIAESTGRTAAKVREAIANVGDLGSVAKSSRETQKTMFQPRALTIASVFKTLTEIAEVKGGDSHKFKVDKIKGLMIACRGVEAKFLVRSLEGKLRIGLAEKTVLAALAHAFAEQELYTKSKRKPAASLCSEIDETVLKEAYETVAAVFSEVPSYTRVVDALLKHPISELPKHVHLTPGIPLKPMLAHPTKAITEVFDRFENKAFICEYKYDGERAQLHMCEDGTCFVFSRNSENITEKYPDLISIVRRHAVAKSFVLDCEAVAFDKTTGKILPFQTLSKRKRKDVREDDIAVNACIFAFDLLYVDGRPLLREPLKERRELLEASFREHDGELMFARSLVTASLDDVQAFLDESVAGSCEGLMVKTLDADSTYEPSRRSRKWLKVKKDYLEGVGDSLDLVVVGGYAGKGKRTGVFGGFLLACYDPDAESYQLVCKIGTGFTEEALESLSKTLRELEITAPKPYYDIGDCKADVWFDPLVVWEVKTADLSISPIYRAAAGLVDAAKGISLRFPRFIRIRDDKKPEHATTAEQIAEMYKKQQLNSDTKAAGGADSDVDAFY